MKLKIIKSDKKYQKYLNWVNKMLDKELSPTSSKGKKLEIVLRLIESYENRNFDIPEPIMSILYPDALSVRSACEKVFNGIESLQHLKFITEEEESKLEELCDKWIKGFDKHKAEVIQQMTDEVLSDKTIGIPEKPIGPKGQIIK